MVRRWNLRKRKRQKVRGKDVKFHLKLNKADPSCCIFFCRVLFVWIPQCDKMMACLLKGLSSHWKRIHNVETGEFCLGVGNNCDNFNDTVVHIHFLSISIKKI